MSVTIKLYSSTSERNRVNKLNFLTETFTLTGTFRDEVDTLNPVIIVESEDSSIINSTYAYIQEFNRYYFINSVSVIINKLYRLYMHVDVLYTYQNDILLQSGYVERREISGRNSYYIDERLPVSNRETISYVVPTSTGSGSTYKNADIDFSGMYFSTGKQLLINTFSTDTSSTSINMDSILGLPNQIHGSGNANDYLYVSSISEIHAIQQATFHVSEGASYIKNILVIPIRDLDSLLTYTSDSLYPLQSGLYSLLEDDDKGFTWSKELPTTGQRYYPRFKSYGNRPIPRIIIADFTIDDSHFENTTSPLFSLNFEPYSLYELYVPLVGYVTVSFSEIYQQRIIVYYVLDVDTGNATATIYNVTKRLALWTGQCQFAINIPLTTTNNNQLTIQKQNATNNLILGLISSGVSIGTGIVSKNPVAIVGGVLSGAKSIQNFQNQVNTMIDKGQVSYGSSQTGLFGGWSVFLRIKRKVARIDNMNIYKRKNGYVYRDYETISSLQNNEYVEISNIQYKPVNQTYIKKSEIEEIENLATNGIIL